MRLYTTLALLLALVLVFSVPVAHSEESWSEQDRTLAYASGALLLADWHTTRRLAEGNWCNHNCFETNPVLGRYPSTSAVDRHFALAPLIFIAADQFPEYRHGILVITTLVESVAVANNIIKFGWSWQF